MLSLPQGHGLTHVVACRVLKPELEPILPPAVERVYLDYALHRTPDQLRSRLQATLRSLPEGATVGLGYGLCSNGTAGLSGGSRRLIVPRVHDCISLIMGSPEGYRKAFLDDPGTIYLSAGWIREGGDPLSDYRRQLERFGIEDAQWIFRQMYQHYSRLVFIRTGASRLRDRRYASAVARWAGWIFREMDGDDAFWRRLVAADRRDPWLLVVEPGQTVSQAAFLREQAV